MPFDGIVLKSVISELRQKITNGKIEKIFQPGMYEIIIKIHSRKNSYKLLLCANPSFPRIHLTEGSKKNPMKPPMFCMLLRKHLGGGIIKHIGFNDYERITDIHVESLNELGDLTIKKLVIEIMGRHSNIILINENNKIIDSVKHVDNETSSVREVMPARTYALPPSQDKLSPDTLNAGRLFEGELAGIKAESFLLRNIKGFSPYICREICSLAGINGKLPINTFDVELLTKLKDSLKLHLEKIKNSDFTPHMIFDDGPVKKPVDFHCITVAQNNNLNLYDSMCGLLDQYYSWKDRLNNLSQKKTALMKKITVFVHKYDKKAAALHSELGDAEDRDKFKLFGELITANIHSIPQYSKKATVLNYYSEGNEYIDIPLNENITLQQNAQRYFKKYTKAKSCFKHATVQLNKALKELEYLESIQHQLEIAQSALEVDNIKNELVEQGYINISVPDKGEKTTPLSKPHRFKSSDNVYIYVGRNNKQNDLLTLKDSSPDDTWLHARNIPGSHVIIKGSDFPDSTLLEAAILAAYHSKYKLASNVPVDYTKVKYVKKPKGLRPGMVLYDYFKTLYVTPDEKIVNKLKIEE